VSHSDSGRMPWRHLHHPTRTRGVRVTTGSSIRSRKCRRSMDESCPSCHTDVNTEIGEKETRMLLANLNHRVSRECVLSGDCELGSAQSRTGCVSRARMHARTSTTHVAMSNEQQLFKQRIRRTTDGGGDSESRPRGGRFCMHVWLGGLRNARPACACASIVHDCMTIVRFCCSHLQHSRPHTHTRSTLQLNSSCTSMCVL
jgi:hypothetical protein